MRLKTAFRFLQVILLSMIFSFGYGQDSTRNKARSPQLAKPNQATVNPGTYPGRAGTQPVAVSTDKSINGQYQFILSKLYRYQQPMITAFYRSIQDSLRS